METLDLAKLVWSETAMLELLGCKRSTLRRFVLEGGLPAVRLQAGMYCFLAGDVANWLEGRKVTRQAAVSDAAVEP